MHKNIKVSVKLSEDGEYPRFWNRILRPNGLYFLVLHTRTNQGVKAKRCSEPFLGKDHAPHTSFTLTKRHSMELYRVKFASGSHTEIAKPYVDTQCPNCKGNKRVYAHGKRVDCTPCDRTGKVPIFLPELPVQHLKPTVHSHPVNELVAGWDVRKNSSSYLMMNFFIVF